MAALWLGVRANGYKAPVDDMTLYRARIRLNDGHPRNRQGARALHVVKRNLSWALTRDGDDEATGAARIQEARLLWRLSQDLGGQEIVVQTQVEPDFSRIEAQPLNEGLFRVRPIARRWEPDLDPGWRGLSLLAAPCHNSSESAEGRRPRRPIEDFGELEDWGRRNLAAAGLEIGQLVVRAFVGPPLRHGMAGTPAALYEGIARIVNPDRYLAAQAAGIGPQKAFGFGLLLLD